MELGVACFLEKDGKGAPFEPWSIFNFPRQWAKVRTEADLSERIELLFRVCNLFCDAVQRKAT
ncbi:hypothetical protein RSWS8N_20574 (plasmid) [Cereibacter sphaeroides WS8N]|nr:hypothetical protein RSWS8N_20574 [Cereibacter sphaeroides WS8N]